MQAMKFQDMPYVRPDSSVIKDQIAQLCERLTHAKSYAEAKEAFLEKDALDRHFSTLANLANLRHAIDTHDAWYEEEKQYWNNIVPEIDESVQTWTKALLASPYRPEFEAEYGKLMFINAEIQQRCFSPAIISQLQAENRLISEYGNLIASAQIPFQGNSYTLSQLAPFKTDPDDATRLAAWEAEGTWYKEQQAALDRIYDELTHLRHEMGQTLGYDTYIPLGYDRMERNCYDKRDVERFRSSVLKYLVPVADRIYRAQAERLGVEYPLSHADAGLMFRSGNPRPTGTPDEILKQVEGFYNELSPETGEFFRTMLEYELMDLLSTPGKEGGGYCTSLFEYELPFIFANLNGTEDDIYVMTHEAGHAFAFWLNRTRIPSSYVWPSMEACEVHSMSMEFFAWPWCDRFFGADTRKYLYSHLAGALTFIPYGTLVDHFQHLVYEKPEMTPAERHETWKDLLKQYMPWMRLDKNIPFFADGAAWQRQSHIYESPFYYIDYCLAQTVALEFWAQIQDDLPSAWESYMAYARQGGSATFKELLDNAGLISPFDEECLRSACEKASAWLETYDLTGIE